MSLSKRFMQPSWWKGWCLCVPLLPSPQSGEPHVRLRYFTSVGEHLWYNYGLSDSSVGKESACNTGDPSLIPGSGRSPGEGIGYPLQYSRASLVAQMGKNLPAMREDWNLALPEIRTRIRVLCQEEVISLQSSAQAEDPSTRFLHPGLGD